MVIANFFSESHYFKAKHEYWRKKNSHEGIEDNKKGCQNLNFETYGDLHSRVKLKRQNVVS